MYFNSNKKKYSLGVELEFQLIDSNTLDLSPKSPQILKEIKHKSNQIKAELFRSMIEINSTPHDNLCDLENDLLNQTYILREACQKFELHLSGTGTHPFAKFQERIVYPSKRYDDLLDRRQYMARRLLIFGMHVHIGCSSKKHVIDLNNFFLHYLPLMQAITTSSPFWQGQETGLHSSRSTIFEAMPTAGHPEIFKSWKDFELTVGRMIRTRSIKNTKDIWWDLRPSLEFGTLEIRVFDGVNRLEDVMAVCYLVRYLCELFEFYQNKKVIIPGPANWVWRENKWRVCRYGIGAKLIDPDFKLVPCSKGLDKTVKILNKYVPQFRSSKYEKLLFNLTKYPSSQRQLDVFNRKKKLTDVVLFNIKEFEESFK